MENEANSFEHLFDRAGAYFETRMDLLKMKSVDKSSAALSSFVSGLALFFILSVSVIITSIGVALWLGELTGKTYFGFYIVGGFYFIIGIILYLFRKQIVEGPVADSFINKVINE